MRSVQNFSTAISNKPTPVPVTMPVSKEEAQRFMAEQFRDRTYSSDEYSDDYDIDDSELEAYRVQIRTYHEKQRAKRAQERKLSRPTSSASGSARKSKGGARKKYEDSRDTPKFIVAEKESGNPRNYYDIDIARSKNTQRGLYHAMYDEAECRDRDPLVIPGFPPPVKIIDESTPNPNGATFNLERDVDLPIYAKLMNRIIEDELRRIVIEKPSAEEQEAAFLEHWGKQNNREKKISHEKKPRSGREHKWRYIRPKSIVLKEALEAREEKNRRRNEKNAASARKRGRKRKTGLKTSDHA